jgi:hypothetical protein
MLPGMTTDRMWKMLEALGLAELPHPTARSRHVRPDPTSKARSEAPEAEIEAPAPAPIVSTDIAHPSSV